MEARRWVDGRWMAGGVDDGRWRWATWHLVGADEQLESVTL